MSIQSHYAREDRVYDVFGCPISAARHADNLTACSGCPWNAIFPGQPQVGCCIFVDYDDYLLAFDQLAEEAPQDHNVLVEILALERGRMRGEGLTPKEAATLLPVAERWSERVADEEPGRSIVQAFLPFVRAAVQTGERVCVFV